jgi:hypothetical protein
MASAHRRGREPHLDEFPHRFPTPSVRAWLTVVAILGFVAEGGAVPSGAARAARRGLGTWGVPGAAAHGAHALNAARASGPLLRRHPLPLPRHVEVLDPGA